MSVMSLQLTFCFILHFVPLSTIFINNQTSTDTVPISSTKKRLPCCFADLIFGNVPFLAFKTHERANLHRIYLHKANGNHVSYSKEEYVRN